MSDIAARVLSLIGSVAFQAFITSILVFLGFLVLAPSRIGVKYINNAFSKDLEEFKAELSLKLEKMRSDENAKLEILKEQLTHLQARGNLSAEREYDAITMCWDRVVDAHVATTTCLVDFIRHPDLTHIGEKDLETFLNASEFSEVQKQSIRDASDRNRTFIKIVRMRNINEAGRLIREARLLLLKQSPFIQESLRSHLDQQLDLMLTAQSEKYVNFHYMEDHGLSKSEKIETFLLGAEDRLRKTAVLVRRRTLREEEKSTEP